MARALLVAERRPSGLHALEQQLDVLNRNLTPDNIVPRKPEFANRNGLLAAVFNPSGATRLRGTSVSIGALLDDPADWHKPGAAAPDGSYALLRSDADFVELVADAAGSRTIWYALTDDRFIAATSQRAIVAVLGDFQVNRQVVAWMLSSGTLGPDAGWDARLEHLRPGERVTLDRASWRLSRTLTPAVFAADAALDEAQHLERLITTVQSTCHRWNFDPAKWPLPLSGGVDSRGLLFMFRERPGLSTVTWGTAASRAVAGNDAKVAQTLAKKLGVMNRFYFTDLSPEPRSVLINRFLTAGEGRVARISGYLDGFLIWKTLFDQGVDGVIRGDEAFGSVPVRNSYNARFRASLTLLSDYFSRADLDKFELARQQVPEYLMWHRRRETLATWRDRIYQEFRIPNLLAALTDLKTPYVEVTNPLLAGAVLERVRALPDELRTDKRLWRKFVAAQRPDVPFATSSAVVQLQDFVNDISVVRLMLDEMESASAAELFAPALRTRIARSTRESLSTDDKRRFKLSLGLPVRWRVAARKWVGVKPEMPPTLLAFRAFIASRMNALLKDDAAMLRIDLGRAANL